MIDEGLRREVPELRLDGGVHLGEPLPLEIAALAVLEPGETRSPLISCSAVSLRVANTSSSERLAAMASLTL